MVSSLCPRDLAKVLDRVAKLEEENNTIRSQLQAALARLEKLELGDAAPAPAKVEKPAPKQEEPEEEDDSKFF